MDAQQQRRAGKIRGVYAFLCRYGRAVEADLALRAGPQDQLTQLGKTLSWRRLDVLIDALARTPGTLLRAELAKDDWTLDQHLLALILDTLRLANWQRAGRKGAPRPQPVSPLARRGAKARAEHSGNAGGRSQEEIDALLHAMRTGALDGR